MITVPRDVFRDAIAHGVIAQVGAKKVTQPKRSGLPGFERDGDRTAAEVLEYATPGGEVVGRLVKACGAIEAWLRRDLATETLVARADAEAEVERIKKAMIQHLRTQGRREKQPESYVLSSALIHAAARHQSRIGRLWDMNSRGDRTRANLAHALDRAVKAEGAK